MAKTATPSLSQAQFDACFAAGVADAQSLAAINDVLQGTLSPLSGKRSCDKSAALWNLCRAAFIEGHAHAGVNPDTAGRRWTRLIEALGFTKPLGVDATKKADQRSKKAELNGTKEPTVTGLGDVDDAETDDAETDDAETDDDAAPASGAATLHKVTMGLDSSEAHLISMLRAGKFAQVHDMVRAIADQTAPM